MTTSIPLVVLDPERPMCPLRLNHGASPNRSIPQSTRSGYDLRNDAGEVGVLGAGEAEAHQASTLGFGQRHIGKKYMRKNMKGK
jgi:hypothetical protein